MAPPRLIPDKPLAKLLAGIACGLAIVAVAAIVIGAL